MQNIYRKAILGGALMIILLVGLLFNFQPASTQSGGVLYLPFVDGGSQPSGVGPLSGGQLFLPFVNGVAGASGITNP